MSFESTENNVIPITARMESTSGPSPETTTSSTQPENAVCPLCFGTGTRIEGDKGARLCDCRRSKAKEKPLELARIPPRFIKRSFDDYYPKNDSQAFAKSFAKTLVDAFPAADRGLLLMGGVGVGKTHLAIAILRELIDKKGASGLFFESGSLLKAIQESYSPISQTSEMRVLAPVYQTDVLVLDELGATVPSDWVRDTLYQIINTRYNNNRLTIFTTNYLDELHIEADLKRLKSQRDVLETSEYTSARAQAVQQIDKRINRLLSRQVLEDRIGTSLRSRLYQMCKKIPIFGDDFRKIEL